jgi:hypothetical protein
MKRRIISFSVFLLLLAGVFTTSCTGKPSGSSGMFSSPVQANAAANDYTKPYLTDEKMTQFLASMKEERNPFEVIFKEGGGMRNPVDFAGRLEEFNSFAHKYGFQDYQDYSAVWGRIMAGQMQIWGADMVKDSVQSFQKMATDAQADLKKPNLSPEMRKMDEDQIANAQKTIDDLNQSNSKSALNAADMELVKKYKDQIEQAQKKYKTGQ